ncbi:MAG: RHS repeat domain-containing protein, partial [Plesiomonas shigelloides]
MGDGLTTTYNALDTPLRISGRGAITRFVYGSDNMRARQTRTAGSKTTTTYYVDKLYETDNDGSWRAYIADAAVLSYSPEQSHKLMFTLRDRLGSATTMVNQAGTVVSRRYFDPFGRGATLNDDGSIGELVAINNVRRGFTDHEHLLEHKLIPMNGRVYDYNIGRFLSVDPFIQSPGDSQSINPYSYLMNNPMAGTDPTGYCAAATGSHIKDCGDLKVEVKGDGKTVGSTVVKNVNLKNGADVSSAMSKGAAQIGQAIADVGSQKQIAQSNFNQQSNSSPQSGRVSGGGTLSSRKRMPELLSDFIGGRVSFPDGIDNDIARDTISQIQAEASDYFGLSDRNSI